MTRLLAFLAFCTLAIAFGGGWAVAETQMQDREAVVDDQVEMWKVLVQIHKDAYADARMEVGLWKDRTQDANDWYLSLRWSLEGMTCIANELLPAFVPRAQQAP